MTVSSVSTLTAESPESFQDALQRGLARARQTLRGIYRVEVVAERARVERGESDRRHLQREPNAGSSPASRTKRPVSGVVSPRLVLSERCSPD